MESRSKSLELVEKWSTAWENTWLRSGLLHIGLGLFFLILTWRGQWSGQDSLEIAVIERPREITQNFSVTNAKSPAQPRKGTRAVYGLSRKAMVSTDGEDVKQGNTTAKTPDADKLKASDADALPAPAEEFLITEMPVLAEEVRIPYPPEAKKAGAAGAVVMDILIDAEGRVREVKLVSGPHPALNEAALKAVGGFRFKAAKIHDKTVAVRIRYAYKFVLER